jgi:hypothetical protein
MTPKQTERRDPWPEYEREKRIITREAKDASDYSERITALAKRLGI